MKILYSFPTRNRPEKFAACVKKIFDLSATSEYEILLKTDDDDETMNEEAIKMVLPFVKNLTVVGGKSDNKIHAVNRDIDKAQSDWAIFVSMSDDMDFIKPGFDDTIRLDMINNFPDLDGVLHYDDGFQHGNVMTMSIMGRKYYNRTGYVYHPRYASVWADVEATEVAHLLGKLWYGGDGNCLFHHLHPVWGKAEWDTQYRKWEDPAVYELDKNVFIKRRANYYDLKNEEITSGLRYQFEF